MQLINYILLSIAVYLGSMIGWMLCHLAPEELAELKKYMDYISNILLFAPLPILLWIIWPNNILISIILLAICVLLIFIMLSKLKNKWLELNTVIANIYLAFIFYISTIYQKDVSLIIASIFFMYFLMSASYYIAHNTKNKKLYNKYFFKLSRYNLIFLIVSIILYLGFNTSGGVV